MFKDCLTKNIRLNDAFFQGRHAVKKSRAQLMRKHSDVRNQLEEMMAGVAGAGGRSSNTAKEMMSRSNRKGEKNKENATYYPNISWPLT